MALKESRDELRKSWQEWTHAKKAGRESISGANPTSKQKEFVRGCLDRETELLNNLVSSIESLKALIRKERAGI